MDKGMGMIAEERNSETSVKTKTANEIAGIIRIHRSSDLDDVDRRAKGHRSKV